MSTEKNSISHWPDPKDYGLPVVEIKPIRSLPDSMPLIEEVAAPVLAPEILSEVAEIPTKAVPPVVQIQEQSQPKVEKVPAPEPIVAQAVPLKEESKSWIGIAAVLAVIILAVICWQMIVTNEVVEPELPVAEATISPVPPVTESESIVNDSKEEEIQAAENQTPEIELPSSELSAIQKPETGTTIDRTVLGTLIRVESKGERSTYYIIVGSLPSEELALAEVPQYQKRVPSVYLISPYDDTRNYRLAIGSFGSFTKANEELARIKADYTEALWILKY